ncbi:MAG: glycosyltransferase family 2 protein [Bacteroidales bacterium]|nr:glycosyltransferase family 2 protein [Bacteroidales bacterium]
MKIFDWVLFIIFAANVLYLLFFAVAYRFGKKSNDIEASCFRRIAVLIPAYKEDAVIEECVNVCLNQDYPKDKYSVVVISDHMTEEMNQRLSQLPIKLCVAQYEQSTKAKALNLAMSEIEDHDIALVFDADNTVDADFFKRINDVFESSDTHILQAHRVAKNLNNDMAVLDAVSEEINNSIFRQGHANLGLSSALIGSGMAFDYQMFKKKMLSIHAVGGFDRNLELSFLKDGMHIKYLPDAYVYDEKVQSSQAFSNQRRRWLSAQIHYFFEFMKDFPHEVVTGNVDFCNKFLQQLAIPRIILLGFTGIYSILALILMPGFALKWWVIFLLFCLTLIMAIPEKMVNRRLFIALKELPMAFVLMFTNLFKLKNANKSFIHTAHGIK